MSKSIRTRIETGAADVFNVLIMCILVSKLHQIVIIIIIIFWLKHQYLKHKYQSMVQQIIANMLSETVYTGITNLYIITKNQQNTKQYIINVNSVF